MAATEEMSFLLSSRQPFFLIMEGNYTRMNTVPPTNDNKNTGRRGEVCFTFAVDETGQCWIRHTTIDLRHHGFLSIY
jgi:hypothetical protein